MRLGRASVAIDEFTPSLLLVTYTSRFLFLCSSTFLYIPIRSLRPIACPAFFGRVLLLPNLLCSISLAQSRKKDAMLSRNLPAVAWGTIRGCDSSSLPSQLAPFSARHW